MKILTKSILLCFIILGLYYYSPQSALAYDNETTIQPNTTVTGNISNSSEIDYYKITLTSPGKVSLNFKHGLADGKKWNISLLTIENQEWNGSYTVCPGDDLDITSNNIRVPAGTYYVKIYCSYSGWFSNIDYQLKVNYTAEGSSFEKQPNEDFDTAYAISPNITYTGNSDDYDDVDYFKLTITTPGKLNLNFKHGLAVGKSWRISLLTIENQEWNGSYTECPGDDLDITSNNVRVPAGTYYVKVTPSSYSGYFSNIDYQLKVNYTAEGSSYEKQPNDDFDTAYAISPNITYTGNLDDSDDLDYYKFVLPASDSVSIKFNHELASGDQWRIQLLNNENSPQASFISSGESLTTTSSPVSLAPGTYYIKVYSGYYDFSNIDYVFNVIAPNNNTPPAVPTGLKATAGNGQVALTWNANTESNLKGYYLYYQLYGTTTWSYKYIAAPTHNYTVTGLTNGSKYSFRVRAANTSNVYSAYSGIVYATPAIPPAIPTGLRASSGNAQVALNWNANTESNLKSYYLYYQLYGATTWSSKYIAAPAHNYTVTGLTNGSKYSFRIRAINTSNVYSAYTSTVTAIPSATPLVISYSPKDNVTGIARNTNLVLTFNQNVSAVSGKNIYIKKTADNTIVETIPVIDTNRVTVSGAKVTINPTTTLAANTGYYVLISAGAFKNASGGLYAGITSKTVWNFTTATATPLVSSYSPADNATGVARNSNLIMIFNQNVSAVSGKNIYIKKTADNTIVQTIPVTDTTRVTVSGGKVTVNPSVTLAANTGYYVLISSGAFKGVNGGLYAGITTKTVWNFTTGAI